MLLLKLEQKRLQADDCNYIIRLYFPYKDYYETKVNQENCSTLAEKNGTGD